MRSSTVDCSFLKRLKLADSLVQQCKPLHLLLSKGMRAECSICCAGEAMKVEDVLRLPCDVLVPAAIGGVITEDNADSLQCKFLVEAANGPTTPEGDLKLRDRGIVVLPDIYTNGGELL